MMTINEKINLVYYKIDPEAHIRLNNKLCQECGHKACTRICPAECYKYVDGELQFTYESCLECGACQLICDKKAIDWGYPKGGFGVCFRFG
jgi:ferredoxin like protein